MIDKVLRQDCVGCKACGDVCPVGAITYKTDVEGFWYPRLNEEICVRCGKCLKVCPALETHRPVVGGFSTPKVYKVYHKDREIRYNSTSGALYYGLADLFLKQGGYIVGCVYNDDCKGAHHMVSNSQEGLRKIMRTKYFQSDTEGIYKEVKRLLDEGKKVLFCGAPCQVSAVYGFVGNAKENLFTVDFICKGTNSPLAFRKFLEELETRYRSPVVSVHLKNKSHGWTNLGTLVTFANGKKYYGSRHDDAWVVGQNGMNLFMRDCCAYCKYKGTPHAADVTMGDFWGLRFTSEEERLGVSVAMVNSEKGAKLFADASDAFVVEESTLETAKKGNPMIDGCVSINPAKHMFFERIQTEPYSKIIWGMQSSSWLERRLRRQLHGVKRLYRRCKEAFR